MLPRSPILSTPPIVTLPVRFDRRRSASANDTIPDKGRSAPDERRDERHPPARERHGEATLP
ncbi:hypothetical protein [Sphingobium sp. HWE2-09]|uniref:hypothetical protein n=1 Tax=Sphingobium sp. HWE2-09 TaxID=3108390 RepID=UPI002DCFD7EF|nr:hypothetical protein [Sphingobium sp. HWE2-09]